MKKSEEVEKEYFHCGQYFDSVLRIVSEEVQQESSVQEERREHRGFWIGDNTDDEAEDQGTEDELYQWYTERTERLNQEGGYAFECPHGCHLMPWHANMQECEFGCHHPPRRNRIDRTSGRDNFVMTQRKT